jgi:hypothetical protein
MFTPEAWASEELDLIFGISKYFYSVKEAPQSGLPAS